jgi:uncharacterized protein YacL
MTNPDSNSETSAWTTNTARNPVRLGYWTLAWVLTMALANFAPPFLWQYEPWLTAGAIFVNLMIGFTMINANKRYLQGSDELQKKIQLEAMALSLGVGLVVGLSYSNLDVTSLITFDAEISHLVILMVLTYAAGIYAGHRRYR